MASSPDNEHRSASGGYGKRELPSAAELLNPRNFFKFLWGFLSAWLVSRRFQRLAAGLPFVLFVAILGIMAWMSFSTSTAERALTYERAAYLANRDGKEEEADLLLTQLTRIRPDDDRVRWQLMLHLIEQDKLEAAAVQLRALTPIDKKGYHPARQWLVVQANEELPKFPLTTDEKLAQLQRAIKENPHDPLTHRLLAATYIERNELRIAEQHLLNSVDQHPSLGLLLYQLQGNLNRRNQQTVEYLKKAVDAFRQRAEESPNDPDIRIYWAQSLALLNNMAEAEAVLAEGIRTSSDPDKSRRALAGLYLNEAQTRLQQSPLNTNIAATSVKKAIAVDPTNAGAIQMGISLAGNGAQFRLQDLQPAIASLEEKIDGENGELKDRIVLGQLLGVVGEHKAAIDRLLPNVDESNSILALLVNLYRADGNDEQSEAMAERLLNSVKTQLDENPESPQALMAYVQALGSARRHAEAVDMIDQRLEKEGSKRVQLSPPIKRVYVTQCLAAFDAAQHDDAGNDAFHFLEQAMDTRTVDFAFLARLSQLSTGSDELAQKADKALISLLAKGIDNGQIYRLIGSHALTAKQHKRASKYLGRAHSILPDDPVIANNYAVALIRDSRDNSEQALSLCNQALEKLPNHPDVLSTRAEINIARSRWEDARRDLEVALPYRAESDNLRRLLVKVFTELEEDDLASEHQKILDELEAEQSSADATE